MKEQKRKGGETAVRTRLVSLLMSGVLAGTALAAQRTAGLPLGTALLTAGGVLGQPASAVQAARQVLEARPVAQTRQEDEESPPVFEAPTPEEITAGQPEPTAAPEEPPEEEETRPEGAGSVVQAHYGQGSGGIYLPCGAGSLKNCTDLPRETVAAQMEGGLPFEVERDSPEPQVLIMHTHATETYRLNRGLWYPADSTGRSTDLTVNMAAVGAEMARVLNEAGVNTIQDTTLHDYPGYTGSYGRSNATVRRYLEKYPSIKIVLDVHRDAIERDGDRIAPIAQVDEEQVAQVMLICGCDNGGNLPNYTQNLRFAAVWEAAMEGAYPGLTRPVLFDYRYYNQDLTTGSLLIEVGGHGNTLEEALAAGRLAAQGLAAALGA